MPSILPFMHVFALRIFKVLRAQPILHSLPVSYYFQHVGHVHGIKQTA